MRVVVQRVKRASVYICGANRASINKGLLILLGIEDADTPDDIDWLTGKILKLRVFNDKGCTMNNSVTDVAGELLIVSQFTLLASTKKGNRPSYIRASKPDIAIPIYQKFIDCIKTASGLTVKTGEFGAMMDVELINDGPVTIIIDSKQRDF